MMNIYELTHIADDPRFGEFAFPEEAPSLLGRGSIYEDFNPELHGRFDWKPVSLKKVWVPQQVVGGVQSYNDYPRVGSLPAFSRRAVDALRAELEANGEILPLRSEVGEYFVYNLLTKSLALDVAKSKIIFPPETASKQTAFIVERFEFDLDKLAGHSIFRIREYPAVVLVTEEFKCKAEQAQLNGLYFVPVYPMPEGQDWEDVERTRWRARRKTLEPLRGQCLCIGLLTDKGKATEEENTQARRVLHSLESILASHNTSLNQGFIGSIDELNERKGQLLIYITCPDVDNLIETIQPWISQASWPKSLRLTKLYGNRFDLQLEWEKVK